MTPTPRSYEKPNGWMVFVPGEWFDSADAVVLRRVFADSTLIVRSLAADGLDVSGIGPTPLWAQMLASADQ